MNEDNTCMLCDDEAPFEVLRDNNFLLEINSCSFRCYQVCNKCALQLRAINSNWYYVFLTREIDSLPKK